MEARLGIGVRFITLTYYQIGGAAWCWSCVSGIILENSWNMLMDFMGKTFSNSQQEVFS